jgi:hypothetical protein
MARRGRRHRLRHASTHRRHSGRLGLLGRVFLCMSGKAWQSVRLLARRALLPGAGEYSQVGEARVGQSTAPRRVIRPATVGIEPINDESSLSFSPLPGQRLGRFVRASRDQCRSNCVNRPPVAACRVFRAGAPLVAASDQLITPPSFDPPGQFLAVRRPGLVRRRPLLVDPPHLIRLTARHAPAA